MTHLPPFAEDAKRLLAARPPAQAPALGATAASVLAPLFRGPAGEVRVWLLRKDDRLRRHGGQIALPGGKAEPGDESPLATALREAEEEIGLPAASVVVLGALDQYRTPTTGFLISPFVGWVQGPFSPVPDMREVSRVFDAPLALFARPPVDRRVVVRAWQRVVPTFDVGGETVWGATAAILRDLARRLAPAAERDAQ